LGGELKIKLATSPTLDFIGDLGKRWQVASYFELLHARARTRTRRCMFAFEPATCHLLPKSSKLSKKINGLRGGRLYGEPATQPATMVAGARR
jgi:hypothetical protein